MVVSTRNLLDNTLSGARDLGVLVVATFITGTSIWLLERRRNEHFGERGWSGFFDAIWWATVTLFTIGYGASGDYDAGTLRRIAESNGGEFVEGTPDSILKRMEDLQLAF